MNPILQNALNLLTEEVYATAKENGFHPDGQNEDAFVEAACNNLHDEISELHEAWRNGSLRKPCDKADKMHALGIAPLTCVEEELSDILIRVLDDAQTLGVDIGRAVGIKNQFNKTRGFRHGGKKS